ncbi:Carboxypeptidase [Rhynchospora pubera]|uniref:Carboxypeptidase n=1 Tax=Rhynchospora pubera TaxID=906938 RepID=A0AAV8EG57_9POAL|nr:Carboxypeptidase [Rhynchospora pubera]
MANNTLVARRARILWCSYREFHGNWTLRHGSESSSTWLQKADLLFVDNPVGTGYSFVEDIKLLVKSDEEAAKDLTTLLQKLYNKNSELQRSPLFIVAESYGGKFAVTAGLSIVKAINAKTLNLKFGGIALGDSWISPEDFVLSWGPLLLDMSRLDKRDAEKSNSLAIRIQDQLKREKYKEAEQSWDELEDVVRTSSNFVDFYNFMNEDPPDRSTTNMELIESVRRRYSSYITSKVSSTGGTDDLMNTVIRRKLRIIPKNISWGGQSDNVFEALKSDFMKPRINEVDELLSLGVNVTVYNGQVSFWNLLPMSTCNSLAGKIINLHVFVLFSLQVLQVLMNIAHRS